MTGFYVDQNIPQVARALRDLGHYVVTAKDLDLTRGLDPVHLLGAATKDRIFVTNNAGHFKMLHEAWLLWTATWNMQVEHAGIVVVPQAGPPSISAGAIQTLVAQRGTLKNELWLWDPGIGWHAYDPLAELQIQMEKSQLL